MDVMPATGTNWRTMMSDLYRCGWCGQPTDKDGAVLPMSQVGLTENSAEWDKATPTNGECCLDGSQAEQERRVTREMALDACDPSLEGSRY